MPFAKCRCRHEFQDATYGIGIRVVTPAGPKHATTDTLGKCTVCGTIMKKNQEVNR